MAGAPMEPSVTGTLDDLLVLVFERPVEVVATAQRVLAAHPNAFDGSIAHQAIGLARREFGELPSAIRHLRTARRLAGRASSIEREADVLASLGVTLVQAGRSADGLAALDSAIGLARGGMERARVRFRKAAAMWVLGRNDEAMAELRLAVPALRRAGDHRWLARALTIRANIRIGRGQVEQADRDYRAVEAIYGEIGNTSELALIRHDRGTLASHAGDIPRALELMDDSARQLQGVGRVIPELAIDRAVLLLSAGLATEAFDVADGTAEALRRQHGQLARRAELLFIAATAALAMGDLDVAEQRARACLRLVVGQGSMWWEMRVRLVVLQIRYRSRPATPSSLDQGVRIAARLVELESPEAAQAHLLVGRMALHLRRAAVAQEHLGRAARARFHGPAAARITGWLAQALLARSSGERRTALMACRRGVEVLQEHQMTLGASDLRARATGQAVELAELAQEMTLGSGRARPLLEWSELQRATAAALPTVRPPDERAVAMELAALRDVTVRLEEAGERGVSATALVRERARRERLVRDLTRHARVHGSTEKRAVLDVDDMLDRLGADRLVEIIAVRGEFHVVVCGSGRVRRIAAGRVEEAAVHVERARLALRSLAYRQSDRLLRAVADAGQQLAEALLGPVAADLGDSSVVLVPPGRLQAVPWSVLPCLTGRVHVVAPSARAWLAAHRREVPSSGRVVVVGGPDLANQGGEVEAVAGIHPGATLLVDASATVSDVVGALDGSALAHICAHGVFRADNPLFSSLRMADGPLTAYDLEGLRRAPHRIVLPSCDAGMQQHVAGDEVLGLASVLLSMGTAGLVAPVVPINDAATVPVMTLLHQSIAAGAGLAEALQQARIAAADDPTTRVAAAAFVAFGAV